MRATLALLTGAALVLGAMAPATAAEIVIGAQCDRTGPTQTVGTNLWASCGPTQGGRNSRATVFPLRCSTWRGPALTTSLPNRGAGGITISIRSNLPVDLIAFRQLRRMSAAFASFQS